ncbi:MAG: hypothetical protein COT89_01465 [Candidatus Colwellbacteria bacterium CG10_big_fil_rev_8_21_14_0_10_42_22]|uniref:General secretion pathway GspH domain-containing protein n=1 Tax=Candidatus Colwellbacteria bacterium CG10_big_fil_rev_8_21_14_0_10_42_22 TaxID=1974540 RepID=A0A2H0VG78_9BACT|nr:MAG: hypothetical protein COT89_01465 [Candidatus Colwellbacteria bacterium CG10_big_fil_rev_8_21_14_0_10_42_22]
MLTSKFLTSSRKKSRHQGGFTLIEVAVVIGVVAILSSALLAYSRQNNRQIQLISSAIRLENIISRAQFLSLQSYFGSESVCAQGVRIDGPNQEVFIYEVGERQGIDGCLNGTDREIVKNRLLFEKYTYVKNNDNRLEGGTNTLSFKSGEIELKPSDDVVDIVFVPPLPVVVINGDVSSAPVEVGVSATFQDGDGETEWDIPLTINKEGKIDVNLRGK